MYFKLIWTISYEEEFEIFITGILYCYYYYHHYYDGDEEKYIVMQMHHKMCHVI